MLIERCNQGSSLDSVVMTNSFQLQLPPTEVQSISRRRESADSPAGTSVSPTAILAQACEDERAWRGKENEIAARTQGYEPNYWSRIKSGEKAAQLERIARLPVKVQKRFVRRYARALGMEVREESPAERQRRALADAQVALAHALRELAG
jgi:hypothetical protein